MPDPTGIGPHLRKLRIRVGLKQVDVTRRTGLRTSYLVRLEAGRLDPQLSTVKRYADAIGARIFIGFPERAEDTP